MKPVTITVYGTPGPQGSKRFVGTSKSGRGILIESSPKVKIWREAVKWAALEQARGVKFTGPISLVITFTVVKPQKPKYKLPATKPDLSKLLRATEDALTDIGIWEDDARIVHTEMWKVYPTTAPGLHVPGAIITISEAS